MKTPCTPTDRQIDRPPDIVTYCAAIATTTTKIRKQIIKKYIPKEFRKTKYRKNKLGWSRAILEITFGPLNLENKQNLGGCVGG